MSPVSVVSALNYWLAGFLMLNKSLKGFKDQPRLRLMRCLIKQYNINCAGLVEPHFVCQILRYLAGLMELNQRLESRFVGVIACLSGCVRVREFDDRRLAVASSNELTSVRPFYG